MTKAETLIIGKNEKNSILSTKKQATKQTTKQDTEAVSAKINLARRGRSTGRVTITDVAKAAGAAVLTGVVARATDGGPLNSALLTGPDGRELSRYDKVNLVPFGEFVPWPLASLTKKVSSEAGDFEAGRDVVVSRVAGHQLGTFICYESVFPGYIRRFAASGAEVLVNISNDGWYGKSPARYQHLQIVRMRAAENQRWILRGTNNGVTAVIDPAGRLIRAATEYEELGARFPFHYRAGLSFYTKFGDWFVALCGLVFIIGWQSK